MESAKVTVGKPKKSGAIFTAPVGTPLPMSVSAAKDPAFKGVGYINEDGVTNSNTFDSSDIKAWGGDTVLTVQEGKSDTFHFVMLETLNMTPMEVVYGSDNVYGSLENGITIKANSDDPEDRSWIIDMVMRNGTMKRIVIPRAKLSEVGDIVYKDNEAVGYDVTVTATPDSDGNTHYEYIKAKVEIGSPTVAAESGSEELFDHLVSEMQSNVTVSGNDITGTLKYIEDFAASGPLAGDGYFLALKLSDFDDRATSVKVGLVPSASGMDLVEILTDPDKNGVFKITDKNTQVFRVVSTDGAFVTTDNYSLAGLTLQEA